MHRQKNIHFVRREELKDGELLTLVGFQDKIEKT
jgi:hypothetical protein